jgi:hypothetical protein
MSIKTKSKFKLLAVAASLVLFSGVAVAATGSAQGATLSCTAKASCGGATLQFIPAGSVGLDLSALSPDANTNGGFGYWNEHVGFTTSAVNNTAQDFIVAQLSGEPVGKGGPYGFGEYAVIYAPAGHTADDAVLGGAGTQTAYCVSVQDTYPVVRGKVAQRWADVFRNCSTTLSGRSAPQFCPPEGVTQPEGCDNVSDEWTVSNADPYQLWAPVEGPNHTLLFQNVGLNAGSLRHGFGGQNFVLDDRAFGGNNTWGIAFPENDGANQLFSKINACSDPVKQFNPVYWAC